MSRNSNLHFCPGAWPAPDPELCSHTGGPLAHPRQSPVQIAPNLYKLRIDPAAIVTHDHTKPAVGILNLGFNGSRSRVSQCIEQRFPRDKVNLLLDRGIQGLCLPLDQDSWT